MPDTKVEAFILYNEQEDAVEKIVKELESMGVSTYFWRRDVPFGEGWKAIEGQRLRDSDTVVVILGNSGWGPNHLQITEEAQRLKKRIVPVLIGDPPEQAFQEANALFRDRRYLDLRELNTDSLIVLTDAIRRTEPSQTGQFDRIVSALVDGSEEQRAGVLRQISISTSIDKPALAARLRAEIRDRFGPRGESEFASAIRDPKKISSIRSWMLSSLIWVDDEGTDSRDLILEHVRKDSEPDRNVRYWTLAGLYQRNASYLDKAVEIGLSDDAPEVAALAQAVASPNDHALIERFRSKLFAPEFETAWQVLRLLRIVPIPQLAADVCAQLDRSAAGSPMAYDAIYALSNPVMAREAVKVLSKEPGVDGVVARVIAEARASNVNAARNFTVLLAAFDHLSVDRVIAEALRDPETSDVAHSLRVFLDEYRRRDSGNELFVAGYASDTINVQDDPLGIQEDVKTLTAVMLAKEVKPPLAIGLFGDWGSGKSFFMRSMRAAADDLAKRAKASTTSAFCSDIVPIEFNAWHYVDTNLWASLVSYILEQLAAHVSPQPTAEQQQAVLLSELGSAKAVWDEADAEKQRAEESIANRQVKLQKLQLDRQQKEVQLRDLRMSDLRTLLTSEGSLKQDIEQSLQNIGAPAALSNISDLSQVVAEAYTVRGRAAALFVQLVSGRNRKLFVTLFLVVLLVIPGIALLVHRYLGSNDFIVPASALISQIIAVVVGLKGALRKAVDAVKTNLEKVEKAKQKVDDLIAAKRKNPTEEEIELQHQIASLRAQEQEAAGRLSAATARVLELEERIRSLKEARSLTRFLAERTRSEEYRKHLGLISIIRQDFESLGTRLATIRSGFGDSFRAVDRIILFIDDLDRCPADKVMEVLQAVHLLLAYPLFVVVVGVDPRWLLHSLGTTYSAFQSDGRHLGTQTDLWRTTPQNYLEKIFQIPFSLRPMTVPGYGKLIEGLLLPSKGRDASAQEPPPGTGRKQPSDVPGVITKPPNIKPDEPQSPRSDSNSEFVIQEESLVIKTWEAKFAERLFALIPSPRAAKRFSNIYRVLKAPIRRDRLVQFEGTAEVLGDFQVPMFLLALLIGAPGESAALFPKLQKHAAKGDSTKEALRQLKTLELDLPAFETLTERIRPIVSDPAFPDDPAVFLEWLPRVSRFSFELGRIVR